MAENTAIEWCDHTFNPWMGCTKVSPGCDHCYAEAKMDTRLHRVQWGAGQPRVRTKTWRDPVRWNDGHAEFFAQHGRRQRVFCASLADVFDNEVPAAWRVDLLRLIESTPNLDWLLLTKRIGNVERLLDQATEMMPEVLAWPMANVWLGATIVNQEEADRDIPKLLAVPARVRFLSIEPMLGPVDLRAIDVSGDEEILPLGAQWLGREECGPRIDWVIVGGESGPGARPMHPDWARSLRDQCAAAGVPFLFKQHGEWLPSEAEDQPVYRGEHRYLGGHVHTYRVGKKAAGRLLDGVEHNGFPEVRHG